MPRPPALHPDAKLRIVLAVLAGATTTARAAQTAGVTRQSVGNWKRQFLSGGYRALAAPAQVDVREQGLLEEIARLRAALDEACSVLQTQRAALHVPPPPPAPVRVPECACALTSAA